MKCPSRSLSSFRLILTSAHVVNDADEILVRLTDKKEFKARLVGADLPTGIALLNARGRLYVEETTGRAEVPIGCRNRRLFCARECACAPSCAPRTGGAAR
jgi:hypothetical protein